MTTADLTPDPLVLARREGAISHLTLNRPRAINALNLEMFEMLTASIAEANASDASAILLDGVGERGFCGGGDVKEISAGDARQILSTEYALNARIAASRVPVVAIMDGITMGGGIGLGGHAAIRIVTERSRLAMPEVRIGIAPDVGGHLLLARAPGRLGELLAITSGDMTAGDAIALGFADHYVPSARLEALRSALVAGQDPRAAVAAVAESAPESPLLQARSWWDPIASAALEASTAAEPGTALDSAIRLLRTLDADGSAEAAATAAAVREMCPSSVVVTLAQIARTRSLELTLREVLSDDLRVVVRLSQRPDFAEGVRAQIIDKDRSPRWNPARIEDLDPAEIAAILEPLRADERALEF